MEREEMWREDLKAAISLDRQDVNLFRERAREDLLLLTVRTGRIVAKILDTCSIPEVMDFLWETIKPGTRKLTPVEEQEARTVFGDNINYQKVRIDENSFIARFRAKRSKLSGLGVTAFCTINFNKKIKTEPGNLDMKWLIHELAHVAQMEYVGSRYMIEASYARATEGYGYVLGTKPHFRDYNREQQASIAADYYIAKISGRSTAAYAPYIAELQAGEL